jgi:TRAP-type mannitol/chloroaromatic compound transport system substrate-binding protein
LPVDLKRILDLATAAVQVHGVTDYHAKNVVAIERLKSEFKGKVELIPFPAAVLRDLRKMAVEVIRDRADKSPMAKKVHASFTKFQSQLGVWDTFAEGAYHQLLRG